MRSTRIIAVLFCSLFLTACAAKYLQETPTTPVTINMGKGCVAYLLSGDITKYTFATAGTQSVQQGTYRVLGVCPAVGKYEFPNRVIDKSPAEFSFGPGANIDAMGMKVTHTPPK